MKVQSLVFCCGLLAVTILARAQDPFEIHIYQYEALEPGKFSLEQHFNYVGVGSLRNSRFRRRSSKRTRAGWSCVRL